MFVRYFSVLPLQVDRVAEALVTRTNEWLLGLAVSADEGSARMLSEVGFGPDRLRIGKVVKVDVGGPVRLGQKVALPMSWHATGPDGLFPVLDGDIEVAPLGPAVTQLAVSARYRPPLGAVGRVMDRALLHRVAEATLKDFVDRIAGRITRSLSSEEG